MRTKFAVPQFIDIEDKILGPVTVRQFIILLVTTFVLFIFFKIFDFSLFLVVGGIFGTFGGVLAFLKVNGAPFHFFLLNMIQTGKRPRLRVWNKNLSHKELLAILHEPPEPPPIEKIKKTPLTTSRLSELTLIVNTGGSFNPED